jgi:hypothetical protein
MEDGMGWARREYAEIRNANKILVVKPDGKRQFERWEYNIKEDLRVTAWEGVSGTHLAWDSSGSGW